MFQVDDLGAGVGVGLDVEFGEKFVEKHELPRVGDQDNLVGAVVGGVAGGGAELVGELTLQHRAELGDHVAGLGEMNTVKFRRQVRDEGLIEFLHEQFDSLNRRNRVSEQRGVVFFEEDRLADVLIKQRRDLRKELVDAQKLKLE